MTRVTGVINETFCSDFTLRTAASTSAVTANTNGSASARRSGGESGQVARCTEPDSNHDHTSSVTNGMNGANIRTIVESAPRSAIAADAAGSRRAAVRASLHQLEVVVAERPEETFDAFEHPRVVKGR